VKYVIEPRVSIIVRTKDRYTMLERAINNIINQSYSSWKIILINDGGDKKRINKIIEDKSEKLQGKIKLIHLHSNKGLNIAINVGAREVDTEFVTIHDDDDTWEKDFLKECIEHMDTDIKKYGFITHTNIIYEKISNIGMKFLKKKPFNNELFGVISLSDILQQNLFPPISFLYRAEVYKEIGYYDEQLKVLEDWDFIIRFLLNYDIHIIEKPLANYHIRKKSKDNIFGNTIITGKKTHIKYSNIIRNKMMRKYIAKEEARVGLLMAIYSGQERNGIKNFIKKLLKKI